MSDRTLEILTAARDRLSEGWFKGAYCNPANPKEVCAAGAVYEVAGVGDPAVDRGEVYEQALSAMTVLAEVAGGYGVSEVNDHPSTTLDDMTQLFNRAILRITLDKPLPVG